MLKKIFLICLVFMLGVAIFPGLTLAQSSSYLESRISRLESENFQLRSQIDRLESQINQISRGSDFPRRQTTRQTPTPPPPPRTTRQRTSQDPMFQNLANLVIELKERVQALEKQVAQLNR